MKLPNLSPSGVALYERCTTKWWFEKIAGKKGPPTAAQEMGLSIHERCEGFIQTGAWADPHDPMTKLAKAGERYLLPLREAFLAGDGKVELLYKEPAGFFGALPLYFRLDFGQRLPEPGITDHKSTGDIYSHYLPTPGELREDPQMLWYAYWFFRDDPPDEFFVQHIYYATYSGPASRNLKVTTEWEKCLGVAKKFEAISHEMLESSKILQPNHLPYNLDACSDYSGCPHMSYCPHHAPHGGLLMGFRDRLKKARAAAAEEEAQPAAEGQMNPDDTPGTANPTEAQLEEICEIIFEKFDPDTAEKSKVTTWLAGQGREKLISVGLGIAHIPRVISYAFDDEEKDEETEEEREERLAAEAKAAEEAKERSEAEAKKAAERAAAAEEKEKADAQNREESEVIADEFQQEILDYLENNGGFTKVNDPEIASIIRTAVDSGRLSARQRIEYLGEMQSLEMVNFNSVYVWLGIDDSPPEAARRRIGKAAGARAPSEKTASRAKKQVKDLEAELSEVKANWLGGCVFLVGCAVQGHEYMELDTLLDEYYETVDEGAVDEDGNPAGSWLLAGYNKGPRTVAALVKADVREGKMPPFKGFVFVPQGHPMAPYLGMMFEDSIVVRGT